MELCSISPAPKSDPYGTCYTQYLTISMLSYGGDYMSNKKLEITPKYPKGEDGHKYITLRLREDLLSQIEEIADQTGRSRNSLITMFIEYALDNSTVISE